MAMSDEEATRFFTPLPEAQLFRILQNQCPHNKGWMWLRHGDNNDCYRCKQCRETMVLKRRNYAPVNA